MVLVETMNENNQLPIYLETVKSGDYPGYVYVRMVGPTLNPKRFTRVIPVRFLRSDGEIVMKLTSQSDDPSTYYSSEQTAIEKIQEFYEATAI